MIVKHSRLWVVSELYFPEQTSTGFFLTAIAEGLAASDAFDVHVICGRPSYSERLLDAPARETRSGVEINRMRSTHFDKDNLILRMVNVITFALTATVFALRNFRSGDQLLIVTNPPTLPILFGFIARLRSMRRTLLVHDVYPDVLVATGMIKPHGVLARILSQFFDSALLLYDRIIVLGRDMQALIQSKIPGRVDGPQIDIITNWGDVEEIEPMDRASNDFAIENGLVDKTVIQFSGNLGRTHDIDLVLEVARRCEDLSDVVFLFVGYGGQASLVERRGGPNVRYLPRQRRNRLNGMLACSDLTVIAFKKGMKGISVPSRMYNIMAAGVAVAAIGDPGSELALVLIEAEAGWSLNSEDTEGLEQLVRSVATSNGKMEAIRRARNGRKTVTAHYNLTTVLTQYRSILSPTSRSASI